MYQPHDVTDWIGFDVPENQEADVHGYAAALPFADEFFDTIVCTETLEHVADPAAVVREMARVLKPGGHVILTTPQYFPVHEAPYDFFRYTPYGLQHLFEGAELTIVTLNPLTTGLRLVAVAINTCFNDFGKELPGGMTWPGRAIFAPIYTITNLFAFLMAGLVPDAKNAVGTALLARKPD